MSVSSPTAFNLSQMSLHLSTPGGAGVGIPTFSEPNNARSNDPAGSNRTPHSLASPLQNSSLSPTYLMPTSPSKPQHDANDGYRPTVKRSTGQVPACLINASVTYCGNNQIYAFGGFVQDTDEGLLFLLFSLVRFILVFQGLF